ncbi:MAG: hypothetical protein MUF69_06950 [Desulfobacterota bacterium]|jgi:hypothetical protein|nr:hypothetical protein [Thermodesulfobacteriota bacterium]
MSYIVLDPTDEPLKTGFTLAPRPEKLAGLTVGLIDNGKKNSDYLLRGILKGLQAGVSLAGSVEVRKPSASHGIPPLLAEELAGRCQVVMAGIGD